jgi:hypothetical protein
MPHRPQIRRGTLASIAVLALIATSLAGIAAAGVPRAVIAEDFGHDL